MTAAVEIAYDACPTCTRAVIGGTRPLPPGVHRRTSDGTCTTCRQRARLGITVELKPRDKPPMLGFLRASWRRHSACSDADPNRFDPPVNALISEAQQASIDVTIRTYCERCPVKPECLEDAIALGDTGIRGGRLLRGK